MVIGVHTLEKIIPAMLMEVGISGKFTLHSLRSTCATRLYERGLDEQIIQEVTGHSSNAVRAYKRTNDGMRANVSAILQGAATVEKDEKSGWIVCSQEEAVASVVVDEIQADQPLQKMRNENITISNCSFSNCTFSF